MKWNVKKMNKEQKIYIAGLFDGDGTIGVYRVNQTWRQVRAGITTIHKEFATIITEITGIPSIRVINDRYSTGEKFDIMVTGKAKAFNFIHQIKPFLILKRKQAEILLKWIDNEVGDEVVEVLKSMKQQPLSYDKINA
jgi:intein/homing endonuclease